MNVGLYFVQYSCASLTADQKVVVNITGTFFFFSCVVHKICIQSWLIIYWVT